MRHAIIELRRKHDTVLVNTEQISHIVKGDQHWTFHLGPKHLDIAVEEGKRFMQVWENMGADVR